MAEQGSKAGRKERHQARARAQRERKKLRQTRARTHAAMQEAARMKRSKKKGTRDFEENMRTLRFEPIEKMTGNGVLFGREISGDVTAKYTEMS
jgi:hypothetical protein